MRKKQASAAAFLAVGVALIFLAADLRAGGQDAAPAAVAPAVATAAVLHDVEIRTLPYMGLPIGLRDAVGLPIRIPCQTCHGGFVKTTTPENRVDKGAFHQHVVLQHGTKTCRTCHKPPDFSAFALADGTTVPYENVMQLCGQCHARRLQEYLNGAHGGMNGYWDRTSGPRVRNHCLDCHNPHAPKVEAVLPAPRIKNRSMPKP